jgi:hypothetical protein
VQPCLFHRISPIKMACIMFFYRREMLSGKRDKYIEWLHLQKIQLDNRRFYRHRYNWAIRVKEDGIHARRDLTRSVVVFQLHPWLCRILRGRWHAAFHLLYYSRTYCWTGLYSEYRWCLTLSFAALFFRWKLAHGDIRWREQVGHNLPSPSIQHIDAHSRN